MPALLVAACAVGGDPAVAPDGAGSAAPPEQQETWSDGSDAVARETGDAVERVDAPSGADLGVLSTSNGATNICPLQCSPGTLRCGAGCVSVDCSTGLPGICGPGYTFCKNGVPICKQKMQPTPEVCNGLDDNCNGMVDEGNPGGGGPCDTGKPGICAAGTLSCTNGALVCNQTNQPSPEVCGDGVDNDCNGLVDDGAACACNNNVLLLGDSSVLANQAIADAMTAVGLNVTTINGGVSIYANVPAANTFGAVVILAGNEFNDDMPAAGQSGIVNAWNSGTTGAVFTEWAAYKVSIGAWQTLGQLLLLDRSGELVSVGTETYTQVMVHPIWTGLPAVFSTIDPNAPGAFNVGQIINGGVAVANITSPFCSTCPTGGAVVKSGASRTVQIAHSASWSGGDAWVNDANLVKMMTNSASWAAKCLN